MNIAFDLSQVPKNKTGVGIYALNLVTELIRLNSMNSRFRFYFFYQDDDPEWVHIIENAKNSAIPNQCNLIPINHKKYRNLAARFLFEQYLLPHRCKKLNIDILFSFHYTCPCILPINSKLKRVTVFHDMTFYLFPKLHQLVKRIYFKSLIPLSLKKSWKIISVSHSTKNDLIKMFPNINKDKIEVIHHGVKIETPPANTAESLQSFNLESKKYFLYVGTLEPRKNIPAIIEAFHEWIHTPDSFETGSWDSKNDFKLVIAGKKGWFYETIFETVIRLQIEDRVVFTGYVEEDVKQTLLSNAFMFIYPSFYEGFGLPVLEAMAYGIPVITGNTSSLPEVAGDAAILISPTETNEIADAMKILTSHTNYYNELAVKSISRAKKFSWKHTAEKTLSLFHTLDKS